MSREVYYRQFNNRRQVAGFLGLATSPYDSGDTERSQGISRTGRGQVRALMIQAAWLWTRHQPKSSLTRDDHDPFDAFALSHCPSKEPSRK